MGNLIIKIGSRDIRGLQTVVKVLEEETSKLPTKISQPIPVGFG